MEIFLPLLMRWLHIFTGIAMVGGAVGGAYLGQPVVAPIARNAVFSGIVAIFISGFYNMTQLMGSAPKGWHMWFGIKFLLALHVFAMIFLLTKTDATAEKRKRWQLSALIGTAAVVAAGAYLRSLRGV
jgi:uncharacterized membrane protein